MASLYKTKVCYYFIFNTLFIIKDCLHSHCGPRDDCSSTDSAWYRPGLNINYNGESSSHSGSMVVLAPRRTNEWTTCSSVTSRPVITKPNKTTSSNASKTVTSRSSNSVDPDVIKERCRIAYGGSGAYFMVEGHGKM